MLPIGMSPAARQSVIRKSAFAICEVTGTTNKSPGKLPCPMTIAGLTLLLLKSVKGIGSSTTSWREQFIVNIVSVVVPDLA